VRPLCLILFFAAIMAAETCDPPARLAEFLQTLPDAGPERRPAIEKQLSFSPEDFWLNRLFLEGPIYERAPIRETYKKRFDAHPESLDDEYLYARSLVGFKTKEALQLFAAILEENPNYPWVFYSQLEIYHSPVFRDHPKLLASFERLTQVCPSWIEPYRYLTDLDDHAIAAHVGQFRTMLESSKDSHELRLYSTLWSAEFRVRPESEHEAERARIANDVKRLQAFEGVRATIASGAKLIGDDALAKRMATPRQQSDFGLASSEERKWEGDHFYPKRGDPAETFQAYGKAKLEMSARLIAIAPDRVEGYYHRFWALQILNASDEQIEKAGDQLIKVARTDDRAAGPAFIDSVASEYIKHGIELNRVPSLIQEALDFYDDPGESDLRPVDQNPMMLEHRMDLVNRHVWASAELSQYYEKVGQSGKARSVLAPVPVYLAEKAELAEVPDAKLRQRLLFLHAGPRRDIGDALGSWMKAKARKKRLSKGVSGSVTRLGWSSRRSSRQAKALWKELGRSDEAWQAWVDSIPKPPDARAITQWAFTAMQRVLPKITLKDLKGNLWSADQFANKTTIAVVWATWCGPCVKELPFAKLAEELKGRKHVQVVSLNTDENPGLVEEFVGKYGYTFQVLVVGLDPLPRFCLRRTSPKT
jgi:thiol-disulfide isomerase/thioredoxin